MISLRAEDLGKAYRIYKRPIDSLKELFVRKDYADTFWALRDVSFEVARGGSLGIVGDNGAGKSTLLKLLAGAAAPTVGRVERAGRTSAILTLGAGFHPDLSGLENIRIGCAVLGLSPAETEALTPRIIEFSELGSFVERPVRTYSSGMSLRLGFSVSTAVDPDILVVDEHLSVGDQHFRHKCMRRIMALRETGCTLVFCSHDLHSIGEICDRVLWLRDGSPAMLAAAEPVLKAYQDHVRERDGLASEPVRGDADGRAPEPTGETRAHPAENFIRSVELGGDFRDGQLQTGGRLELRVVVNLSAAIRREGIHIGILIIRNDAVWCYGVSTKMDDIEPPLHPLGGDDYGLRWTIDELPLLSGHYSFTIGLMDAHSPHLYDTWSGASPFVVRHQGKDVGVARIAHRWEPLSSKAGA